VDKWEQSAEKDTNWVKASVLGQAEMEPWKMGEALARMVRNMPFYHEARAALLPADPLMTALGRPNREQVVTTRPTAATTLQALELTNGGTVSENMKAGAARLKTVLPADPEQAVTSLFVRGLGRKPTAPELALGVELLGGGEGTAGLEDLLWSVTMLPEFQLIY
jgi:hypothetical protein